MPVRHSIPLCSGLAEWLLIYKTSPGLRGVKTDKNISHNIYKCNVKVWELTGSWPGADRESSTLCKSQCKTYMNSLPGDSLQKQYITYMQCVLKIVCSFQYNYNLYTKLCNNIISNMQLTIYIYNVTIATTNMKCTVTLL